MTLNVGIFLFPEAEALDFAGPYEVFTTASRVALKHAPGTASPFRVFSVAATSAAVAVRAGLRILPDVMAWIARHSDTAQVVASVCTGVFLLAQAGVLSNEQVTTHWEDLHELAADFPDLSVVDGPRWVDVGRYVTSVGISAGLDMCLHLVRRLHGLELALATARQMDYALTPDTGHPSC